MKNINRLFTPKRARKKLGVVIPESTVRLPQEKPRLKRIAAVQTVSDKLPKPPHDSASVLWVTNLAAPYRRPVWTELGTRHRLTVALLESNVGLSRDSSLNRAQDWFHVGDGHVTFIELPTWKYARGESRYYTLRSLRAAYSVRKHDVVLFGGWESPAYWVLMLACIVFGTARVAFYESPRNTMTHSSGPIALLRAVFFHCMHRVVVPGAAAHEAVAKMAVPQERIVQGFNAVDVTSFHAAATSSGKQAPPEPTSGHRYLFVGQLIPRKRVLDIVKCFTQVAGSTDELTIVGTGEQLGELEELASAHEARIFFLGQVENSELPLIMTNHQTLVLASQREVWGLVVNEALASGMHVVVTENCGVTTSVAGMRGVYTARENLQDLGEQMQKSKLDWSGRIETPQILQFSPALFADVFEVALIAAINSRQRLVKKLLRKMM